jgi:DNA-directed RNA polymerase subunit RPC12/RpoP
MKTEPVRCWPISLPNKDGALESGHWITFPEDNSGHDLIVCTNCGHLYAVNIARMVYVGPTLAEKLETVHCVRCGKQLNECGMKYPEVYLDASGSVLHYERDSEIPSDDQSVVRDFDQLY